jgi:multidrug resistance efflux pump
MLMPGVPALVLTDLNALEVHLNIGESYIQHIQTNQTVSIDILALNIQVQSPIEAIIPNSTATHRGFIVKIPLPKIKNAYPGMYAEVTFSLKSQNE